VAYSVSLFQEGGRLLYIGQNEWTHVNCALWSSEVFEDDDSSLKNVHMAVLRGRQMVRCFVHCFQCTFMGQTLDTLLCFLFSAVRSVKREGPRLAAASPLAPITTTSCVPVSATASS